MKIPYGYVYRIRNKINGKTYVGQRKLSLDKRWRQYMGSGVLVKAAIAKYGIEAFTKELLAYSFSYDDLNKIEVELILQDKKDGKAEYNLHIGSPVPRDIQPFKNMTPEQKEALFKNTALKNKERFRLLYERAIAGHEETIIDLYSSYGNAAKVANHLNLSKRHVMRFLKEQNIQLNHQTVSGRITDDEVKKKISNGMKNSTVKFQLVCDECGQDFESKSFRRRKCEGCTPEVNPSAREQSKEQRGIFVSAFLVICMQCNNEFENGRASAKYCSHKCSTESNRKELPPIEVIEKLYWEDKISANKIGAMYSVSGQTIRKYMKRHGLDRRDRNHKL